MPDTIITVENLSKSYLVGHQSRRESYASLRDVIAREARSFGRKFVDLAHGRQIVQGDDVEEFWALKNVSFEIQQGEIVGIVGRNGAGKSTLLKLLSRITEPTEGRIKLRGRVASLLEVGTGFHPELTGRENIFLNGAILGMTQREIRKKFDEIVAFAEVERFLDTPVKRYSSGMYVRLAFAVAAHLDPEILLVDEVLAVGDVAFQKKCLGKIEAVSADEGRTVIFISHNTDALLGLCNRGILLEVGKVVSEGGIQAVVEKYLSQRGLCLSARFEPYADRPSITSASIDEDALKSGDLIVDVGFVSPRELYPPIPGIVISSALGTPVFGSNPRFHNDRYPSSGAKSGVARLEVRGLPIVPGQYRVSAWLGDWQRDYDHKADILSFDFRSDIASGFRPKAEVNGYLDWKASWQLL